VIFIVLSCFVVWSRMRGKLIEKTIGLTIIAVLLTGMTVITAGSIPVVEIPTGLNQELRVMPPTAFPFTMQQFRDYDANQFYYRIVIGWPNGIPIYEGIAMDDQSEFIHLAHLHVGVLLGEYVSAGIMMTLAVIFLFELQRRKQDQDETNDINVKFLVKFSIPVIIFSISFVLFLFPEVLSFLPGHFIFAIGFWGMFVGFGAFLFFLFIPNSILPRNAKNE